LIKKVEMTGLPEGHASYLYINDGGSTARTAELSPAVNVDLDMNGRIVGVERIGGRVDIETLVRVLEHCRWEPLRL
jgi:uncharacterized protein YuzE